MPKLLAKPSPSILSVLPSDTEMLRRNTPLEDYRKQFGLWVKREDLSCPLPGPPFSKARGVYAHLLKRPEKLIGVLDTAHSKAGWAVARACQVLDKECLNFYPSFKQNVGPRIAQIRAQELGAELYALPAGRSAILYHSAKRETLRLGGYPMPNALKLEESVQETAVEVSLLPLAPRFDTVLIPVSSGTIAAGVVRGFADLYGTSSLPQFIIHLGYTRSHDEVERYILGAAGRQAPLQIVDEKYQYKDEASSGITPPFPCNEYYDLKAFRWWMGLAKSERLAEGNTLLWNIG